MTDDYASTASFLLGISAGWEYAAMKLRTQAGHYFTLGRDEVARNLRDLSDQLMVEQKAARKKYDEYCGEHNVNG